MVIYLNNPKAYLVLPLSSLDTFMVPGSAEGDLE